MFLYIFHGESQGKEEACQLNAGKETNYLHVGNEL